MDIDLLLTTLTALSLAVPFVLLAYFQRLPVAPSCPLCRALTRERESRWGALPVVTLLPTTYLGECTRCGWHGRMRWRWATRSVRSRREP